MAVAASEMGTKLTWELHAGKDRKEERELDGEIGAQGGGESARREGHFRRRHDQLFETVCDRYTDMSEVASAQGTAG